MSGAPARDACELATNLMAAEPDRLRHLAAVASRADALSVTVDVADVDVLVAAAWLHDIGYLPILTRTGFHPLDGALYLRDAGWPDSVCNLVAHHSGSRFVARVRDLDTELNAFAFSENPSSDALTTADNTATQHGGFVAVSDRLAEKRLRHPPNSPGMLANPARDDYIVAAAGRVRQRLEARGISDPYLH